MPRWDDDDDDLADDDLPEGVYHDDDGDTTIDCPYCGQAVYEDAEQCPNCHQYLSLEDAPSSPKPWWIVAGAVVCLAIVLVWIFW